MIAVAMTTGAVLNAGFAQAKPGGAITCRAYAVGARAVADCVNSDDHPGTVTLTGLCGNLRVFRQANVPIAPNSPIRLTEDCGRGFSSSDGPINQNAWGETQYQKQHQDDSNPNPYGYGPYGPYGPYPPWTLP